jgi:murein tripeptide amidase MpaA
MVQIDSRFPSGNIDVVAAGDPADIRLRIRPDPVTGYFQWFYYRVVGAEGRDLRMTIENANEALVPKGWLDYRAFTSLDGAAWFRVPTDYDGNVVTIAHRPERDSIHYAYFPPYTSEDLRRLIGRCQMDRRCRAEILCRTVDGEALDLLTVGTPGRPAIWAIGRQHPGEVQASWWMEGFLDALLDKGNADALALLERATFYVVPNMNPDGTRRGQHRTNAGGVNLNQQWEAPSQQKGPEVFHVLERMTETGVAFCLDVHGDEELPFVFFARVDLNGPMPPAAAARRQRFGEVLSAISPGCRPDGSYVRPHSKIGPMAFCGPQIVKRFGAPAVTLELPYKDVAELPDPVEGYSVRHCRDLGRACVRALAAVLPGAK